MSRTFTQRIHNPRNRECACDPDCWCQRTSIGRAVKWWFPARFFGPHHKNRALAEWKRQQTGESLADWKRRKDPDRPQSGSSNAGELKADPHRLRSFAGGALQGLQRR